MNQEEVSSILSKARFLCQKTRKEIAKHLGIPPSAIESWENGDSLPPFKRAEEIAKVYGLDISKFTSLLKDAWAEHEKIRSNRKALGKKRKSSVDFSGEIESAKTRERLNIRLKEERVWFTHQRGR